MKIEIQDQNELYSVVKGLLERREREMEMEQETTTEAIDSVLQQFEGTTCAFMIERETDLFE